MAVIGEVRTSDMLGKDLKLVRDLYTLIADVMRVPDARAAMRLAPGTRMTSAARVDQVTVCAFAGSLGLGSVIGSFAWADHG